MVEPIERKKISEQVLLQLKTLIKDKVFPPHSKLPSENELAKMFGVSRVPVREALRVLEAGGLIESKQGGGSFVKDVQLVSMLEPVTFEVVEVKEVYELLEMRSIIETEAAGLAAVRHTAEDLQRIEKALEAFRTTVTDLQLVGDEADYLFHQEIIYASHNRFLIQVIENMKDLYLGSLSYSLKKNLGIPQKRERVYNEHARIYEAIKCRDAKLASQYMKEHITNTRIKLGDTRCVKM